MSIAYRKRQKAIRDEKRRRGPKGLLFGQIPATDPLPMNELSLFTGAGGGLLGTHLLGWTPVGYVEFDDYCQQILKARIDDKILPRAPIFGDIDAFISDGYADCYQGLVDVVTAGFPCQPFSVAGARKGDADSRNMWPQTIDVIRRVRPPLAFLENVSGLLAHEYARRIYGDLAESGYDCRWRRLSAAEVGAPHRRDRWWCIAYANSRELRHTERQEQRGELPTKPRDDGAKGPMANTDGSRELQSKGNEREIPRRTGNGGESGSYTNGKRLAQRQGENECGTRADPRRQLEHGCWWLTEPDVGRVAHGVASRVDRLKATGNGQVSAVVRAAWQSLMEENCGSVR